MVPVKPLHSSALGSMCAVPSGVNVGLEVRSETTRERVEAKAEDEYVRGG